MALSYLTGLRTAGAGTAGASGGITLSTGSSGASCSDDSDADEAACAQVVNGWQYVAAVSPVAEYCVNAGGDTIADPGTLTNAGCQAVTGGYEWLASGKGSSGLVVLRTGSAPTHYFFYFFSLMNNFKQVSFYFVLFLFTQ